MVEKQPNEMKQRAGWRRSRYIGGCVYLTLAATLFVPLAAAQPIGSLAWFAATAGVVASLAFGIQDVVRFFHPEP